MASLSELEHETGDMCDAKIALYIEMWTVLQCKPVSSFAYQSKNDFYKSTETQCALQIRQ